MCGRYVIADSELEFSERFRVDRITDHLQPGYNLTPGMRLPVISQDENGLREMRLMVWGLRKSWWDVKKRGPYPINARADGIAVKPTFGDSVKRRRCIVPASGYYEWTQDGAKKQPYYIHLKNGDPIGFAGLWETFDGADGKPVLSYAIITTTPADSIAHIHDRMPVILHRADEELWLDPRETETEAVVPLLVPFDTDALEAWPVDTRVGSRANNDPSLIEPIATQQGF